jgi:hypothetical protein
MRLNHADTKPPSGPELYTPDRSIANDPATNPPMRRITVCQPDLERWEYDWADNHEWHAINNPCAAWQVFEKDGYMWRIKLLGCCGEIRPTIQEYHRLIVRATTRPFVTVKDFISMVRPWLLAIQEDILSARAEAEAEGGPHPPKSKALIKRVTGSGIGMPLLLRQEHGSEAG